MTEKQLSKLILAAIDFGAACQSNTNLSDNSESQITKEACEIENAELTKAFIRKWKVDPDTGKFVKGN